MAYLIVPVLGATISADAEFKEALHTLRGRKGGQSETLHSHDAVRARRCYRRSLWSGSCVALHFAYASDDAVAVYELVYKPCQDISSTL